jgi:hypothetical protein
MTDTLSKLKALIATANGAVYKSESKDPDTQLAALLCNNAKALIAVVEAAKKVVETMRPVCPAKTIHPIEELVDALAALESANETKD